MFLTVRLCRIPSIASPISFREQFNENLSATFKNYKTAKIPGERGIEIVCENEDELSFTAKRTKETKESDWELQ